MADKEITVLLMLEAIDRASSIFEKVSSTIEGLGKAAKDAATGTALEGDALDNAKIKAEAAANAVTAAQTAQSEAQVKLTETSAAARDALTLQSEAEAKLAAAAEAADTAIGEAATVAKAAYAEMSAAAEAAAATAKTAVAEQVTALDALKKANDEVAERTTESKAAQDALNVSNDTSSLKLKALTGVSVITAAAVAGIGVESVKAAANFQQATSVLVTSGGETEQNISMVRQGILQLAASTGTATQELTNGMYMIGSAGYTGADGLTVLKAAAQGAKAENADLGTVSNALTTILHNYGMNASQATAAMNQMITVVQNGKTTTEALASSLSTVLPIAAKVGLSFDQVGGAMATMTASGMTAQNAAQNLAGTINHLNNPSMVASKEMAQLGLNSVDLSKNLGKVGLAGTIKEVTDAIQQHMGPAGTVVVSAFQNSAAATQNLNQIMSKMPSSLKSLATEVVNGTISTKDLRTATQGLNSSQAEQISQLTTVVKQTHQFNSALTSGTPAQKTAAAALQTMLGGQVGLNTALMLSSNNYKTVTADTNAVGKAGKDAGANVEGWSVIQQNMNQRLAELKETVQAAAIQLGTALLPMVTKILGVVMKIVTPIADWISHNQKLAATLLLLVGALAGGITVLVLLAKAIEMIKAAMVTFGLVAEATGEESALAFGPIGIAIAAVAAAALLIITNWSTVKRWIGDFWSWFKQIFNDAKNFVEKWWPELLAPMTAGTSIIAKFIMDHWSAIFGFLKKIWGDLVGVWNDTGGKVVTAIAKAFDWVTGEAKKALDFFIQCCEIDWGLLEGLWNRTGGKAVTAIAKAWDEASRAVSKEWDKITSDLSSIWQSLVTIWNATGGRLVSLIADNWSTIVGLFDSGVHLAEDVVKPPLDFIVTVFKTTFDVLSRIASTYWNAVVSTARTALGLLEMVAKVGLQLLEMSFTLTWDVIKTIVSAAWSVISGLVMGGFDVIEGFIKAGWDLVVGIVKAAWDIITTIINVALDLLTGIFKIFADLVTGNWSKLWNDVKDTASKVWNDIWGLIKGILGDIGSTVTGAVSSIFGGFEHGIESAVKGVTNALSDVYHGIINYFKDAGSWLVDIGKSILQGLVKGAESALGDVESFFKGIGHDIVSWKGPPEYDAIMLTGNGQLIMKGLITGLDSQTDALHSKLGAITTSIRADVSTGTRTIAASASGLAPANATGSGTAGTVINLNVTGNSVMSDSDTDKLVTKIGNRLTQQILPSAGVRFNKR